MDSPNAEYNVELLAPNACGYVVLSLQVDPESVTSDTEQARKAVIGTGVHSSSAARGALFQQAEEFRPDLMKATGVLTVSVFEAIYFDHGTLDRHPSRGRDGAQIARYDVVMIIKTDSVDHANQLRSARAFEALTSSLRVGSKVCDVLTAWNVKRAADVDRSREGVFLINYFFAEKVDPLLDVWDHTAGWWATEGQMANSELLRPETASGSDYAIINTARWDDLGPAMDAFSKETYGSFVLANIDAHGATTMPALYRLVA